MVVWFSGYFKMDIAKIHLNVYIKVNFLFFFSPFSKIKQGLLPSLEDLLFYTIAEGQEKIPVHKFITVSLYIFLN